MLRSESPPETTEQFARRVFTGMHQTIIAREGGALNGDVEAIHDMRVAIRRMRVALSNFAVCLPPQDRRRLRDRLEHLAEALGAVRDLDVMILTLTSTRQNRNHPAISSYLRRLRARRRSRHRNLVGYLRGDEYIDFKLEFSPISPDLERKKIQAIDEKGHGQAA